MTEPSHHAGWDVERVTGSAQELHARSLPDPPQRTVWAFTVDRPALVLGSTQASEVVDPDAIERAGVEVARRHSGGGAVLLVPDEVTWIDVVIPATDPLWEPDVGAAFLWLGRSWREALTASAEGATPTVDPTAETFDVYDGPLVSNRWSALVCFAGLGPGEVTAGSRKVVGLSQRRTRQAVRFQCVVHHRFRDDALAGFLDLSRDDRGALAGHLRRGVGTVRASPAALSEKLVAAFPE